MPIAQGINKQLRFKLQSALGVSAGASGGEILRRVTSDLNLTKDTYQSNEIRVDAQIADYRHGARDVSGSINGELSPGSYDEMFANILRRDFAAGATTTALTTVTAASTAGAAGTFTRSAGSYLTDGFKIGDVIRWTGWATTGTPNNAHNFLITALTATVMTVLALDGVAIGAKAAGDSVTGSLPGKKTFAPVTALTDKYITFEHWFPDIAQSELFTDCKVGEFNLSLPASGMSQLTLGVKGLNMTPATAAFFTAPSAQSSSGVVAAVNGVLLVGGAAVGLVTGLTVKGTANLNNEPVVGSNVKPDLFRGTTMIDGEFTAYFQDAAFRDIFLNETEASVIVTLTTANTAAADFVSITLPRVKAGGASKDDGQKGLVQTIPFMALLNTTGGTGISSEQTTMSIQDSLAS